MSHEPPSPQDSFKEAVQQATLLMQKAVESARKSISESFHMAGPVENQMTVPPDAASADTKDQRTAQIVHDAFQQAKAILDHATNQFTEAHFAESQQQQSPNSQPPFVSPYPGRPGENPADSASGPLSYDDIMAQNMKWVDNSLEQLVQSWQKESQFPAAQPHQNEERKS